jgi:rare lipoprotein A
MRFIALAALAVMSVGLFGALPASAATKHCHGEYACKHAKKVAYRKANYKKVAAYRAKKAAAYRANKERAYKVSYKTRKHVKQAQYKPTKRALAHRKSAAKTASYGGGGGSSGMASYYWQGQQTASGARFNPSAMTAAHRTLPFGTRVVVTNRNNGRSVTVTINDRGPFIKGRIIDLSRGAASAIGMTGAGLARVSISVL